MNVIADKIEQQAEKVFDFASPQSKNSEKLSEKRTKSPNAGVVKTGLFMVKAGRNLILHGLTMVPARSKTNTWPIALQPIAAAAVLYRMYCTDSIPRGVDGNA